jgi:H+/Cl- antiporter ClcA
VVAITASIRAGAAGGVLTPSLTVGALLAVVLGHLWTLVFPNVPTAAAAIVGAAAFLASSMNMPLTAIALTIEFTRVGHDLWVPIFLAVAGSAATLHACARRGAPRSKGAAVLNSPAPALAPIGASRVGPPEQTPIGRTSR